MSKFDWENGKSTRSGLLWEVERILKELKDDELPQVLLMENVPQVHSEQNIADFESWLNFLRSRGYYNFYQDLNAKDYGIPQNRERCFCVSILSDEFIEFNFPKPIKLEKVMKDYLDEEVEEKYYIKNEKAEKLIKDLVESGVLPTEQNRTDDCTQSTCASIARHSKLRHVSAQEMTQESASTSQSVAVLPLGHIEHGSGKHQSNMVYDKNGLCPTVYAVLCKEPFKVVE